MPNIKSIKKRVKTSNVKRLQNKMFKSALHTALKKALREDADDFAKSAAVSMIDRSVTKGILHKNNAARKKSMLARKNKVLS
jgi:small subunit ribosomal protein S20